MTNPKESTTKKKTTTAKNTSTKKVATSKKTTSTPKTVEISKIKKQEKETIAEKEQKNNITLTIIGIIVLVVVAIIIFRLTYAYFTATIKKTNPDITNVDIKSADLLVRYQDGNSNIKLGDKIKPGDVLTKEFSVLNEGNDTGFYTIILENLTNTFDVECKSEEYADKGEISYTLFKTDATYSDESSMKIGLGNVTLPCTESPITFVLAEHISVDINTTNYYKLEITYKNLAIDQSDNMDDAYLTAKINIVESELEKRTD